MRKTKKGEMVTGAIVGVFILVLVLVIFIPLYVDSVDSADSSRLACNDAVLDTLNTTGNDCYNGTHMSVTEKPSEEGLTGTQEVVLLIVPTFVLLGLLFFVGKKAGFLGNN